MRTCMFCGGGALTKEDAWPLWLVRLFPTEQGVAVEAERGNDPLKTWRQTGHFAKVRHVCADCNNGWMSRLESDAKLLVTGLLAGRSVTLSEEGQRTLGKWSLKTAMVFEALRQGSGWFYEVGERATLREGRIPQGYTAVWLAACVNLPGIYCTASDMSESGDRQPSEARGYLTTMAFGTVAIQVLTLRPPAQAPPGVHITTDVRQGPWSEATVQVWPPHADAGWPPSLGLNGEEGLEHLAKRFRPLDIAHRAS